MLAVKVNALTRMERPFTRSRICYLLKSELPLAAVAVFISSHTVPHTTTPIPLLFLLYTVHPCPSPAIFPHPQPISGSHNTCGSKANSLQYSCFSERVIQHRAAVGKQPWAAGSHLFPSNLHSAVSRILNKVLASAFLVGWVSANCS